MRQQTLELSIIEKYVGKPPYRHRHRRRQTLEFVGAETSFRLPLFYSMISRYPFRHIGLAEDQSSADTDSIRYESPIAGREVVSISLARAANVYMQTHYNQISSVYHLASTLEVEVHELVAAYRQVYARDIAMALKLKKVKAAQRLLAQTSLELKEIAREAGWYEYYDFLAAFRYYVGMPPAAFRELPYSEQISALMRPG